MSKREKDILEEMFHAKLHDHEVDTTPGDWEAIMDRLPESKPVTRTLRRSRLYWSAAAAIAALVVATGILFLSDNPDTPLLSDQTEQPSSTIQPQQKQEITEIPEITPETSLIAATTEPTRSMGSIDSKGSLSSVPYVSSVSSNSSESSDSSVPPVTTIQEEQSVPVIPETAETTQVTSTPFIADASRTQSPTKPKNKTRRWGFGMGGGSLTAGANNTFNTLVQASASYQTDDKMLILNAPLKSVDYKTELKHRTPVNVGISGSYYINNRWSLQAGLSYSLLVSESKQNTLYHKDEEQRLHFIGIPISIAYRIMEWNSLQWYVTAGLMPEINVAGKYKIREFSEHAQMASTEERVRMKDLYWSVNARTGVSYPVLRYVNAFAEVGGAYYFDNGSDIKTIHSEKPFNVSFNFGLRFGF